MEDVELLGDSLNPSDGESETSSTQRASVQSQNSEFDETNNIWDGTVPVREALSARYKSSFAYTTFRVRVPAMLSKLMSCLEEHKTRIMEQCGEYARCDLRRVIWSLDILRDEVLQNSAFKPFHDKEPDTEEWNNFIELQTNRERNQWFSAAWMHAECYLYRRISAAFRRTETLRNYDYFGPQKICSTRNLVYLLNAVLKGTRGLTRSKSNFRLILKLSLWANRCDLSNTTQSPSERILEQIGDFDQHLLVDQSKEVWQLLSQGIHSSVCPAIVDIVLDNAGFELFTDLLLGEYLINTKLAAKVRYHVKAMPWFVSDVTAEDFHWMLDFFLQHEMPQLSLFGRKLGKLMRNKKMELFDVCSFWTKPHAYKSMREMAPCLYVHLTLGALTIFKGDLNYRKLLDDTNWCPTSPLSDCLGGFLPTSICMLRSIKSDLYCGLPICTVEWLTEDDPNWMCTGEKAVIQLVVKQRP